MYEERPFLQKVKAPLLFDALAAANNDDADKNHGQDCAHDSDHGGIHLFLL